MRRNELLVLLVILVIAAYFRLTSIDGVPPGLLEAEALNGNRALALAQENNLLPVLFSPTATGERGVMVVLQAAAIKWFGNTAWSLRIVSALSGVLTVWGLYLLARRFFNSNIAAIASFLLATSLWHVMFSRLGLRMALVPLAAVWGLYLFWLGLASTRLRYFAGAAVVWSLGWYTHSIFAPLTLVLLATLAAYWKAIQNDFSHERYLHTRLKLIRGMAVFLLISIVFLAPLAYYAWTRSDQLLELWWNTSVLSGEYPIQTLIAGFFKAFALLLAANQGSWTFGIASSAILFWPVAAFFAVGLLKSCIRIGRSYREHGHASVIHLLLVSWFVVGLASVALKGGDVSLSMLMLVTAPAVFLFAALGLWWLFEYLEKQYYVRDVHQRGFLRESSLVSGLVIVLFIAAVGISEYGRYFRIWSGRPEVAQAYAPGARDAAAKLNAPGTRNVRTYVVVPPHQLIADGLPLSAQPLMYLTDTATPAKQREKNIYYLTREQYRRGTYQPHSTIIFLDR